MANVKHGSAIIPVVSAGWKWKKVKSVRVLMMKISMNQKQSLIALSRRAGNLMPDSTSKTSTTWTWPAYWRWFLTLSDDSKAANIRSLDLDEILYPGGTKVQDDVRDEMLSTAPGYIRLWIIGKHADLYPVVPASIPITKVPWFAGYVK